MKRTIMGAAALALGMTLVPAPAQATTCVLGFCYAGRIVHVNDTGYDKPLIILCDRDDRFTERKFVQEGTSSVPDCPGRYDDVDVAVVREGEEWWCEDANSSVFSEKELTFDRPGKHYLGDKFQKQCVVQRD